MKNIIAFIAIIVLAFTFTFVGPWYLVALAGFIGGFMVKNQWRALLIGLLAGGALWALQLYLMQQGSTSDLPARMAQLIGVGSAQNIMLVSIAIGALLTGFGAAAGGALTQKKRAKRKYA